MFSLHEYTWVSAGKGGLQFAAFVATILSVIYAVSFVYPDKVAYPREFEGGLLEELGGSGAVRVSTSSSREAFTKPTTVRLTRWIGKSTG